MNFSVQKVVALLLYFYTVAHAAPPVWWAEGSPAAVDSTATANNHGMANVGQAKWMAKCALLNLRATVPEIADLVEGDLVGIGKPIISWVPPATNAEREKLRSPLNIGQLKALAAPFYQRIHAPAASWLEGERATNQMPDTGTFYPWTASSNDDSNLSPATIGQLKAVFSLRFAESNDGDSVSDLYEYFHFGSTNSGSEGSTQFDLDGDGWLDSTEQSVGGNTVQRDNPKLLLQITVQ